MQLILNANVKNLIGSIGDGRWKRWNGLFMRDGNCIAISYIVGGFTRASIHPLSEPPEQVHSKVFIPTLPCST